MRLFDHPTVKHIRQREFAAPGQAVSMPLDAAWLKQLALDCGADDAGLVEISRPALDDQREDILRFFPGPRPSLFFSAVSAR